MATLFWSSLAIQSWLTSYELDKEVGKTSNGITGSTRKNGNKADIRGLDALDLSFCFARVMDMPVTVSVDNEKRIGKEILSIESGKIIGHGYHCRVLSMSQSHTLSKSHTLGDSEGVRVLVRVEPCSVTSEFPGISDPVQLSTINFQLDLETVAKIYCT